MLISLRKTQTADKVAQTLISQTNPFVCMTESNVRVTRDDKGNIIRVEAPADSLAMLVPFVDDIKLAIEDLSKITDSMSKSSKKLEKLTWILVVETGVLTALTLMLAVLTMRLSAAG